MREFDHGGKVFELAAASGSDWRTFVDFSASINPLGPPEEVLDLLRQHPDLITCYPPNDHRALLGALADYCGLTSDHLVAGHGATELMYFALRFLKPQRALIALPTFSELPRACAVSGVDTDEVLLIRPQATTGLETVGPETSSRGWCVDWQALEDALMTRQPDLLILVHPNNPTGATLDPIRGERLLQLARDRGVTVLLDESFIDFAPEESWLASLHRHEHLIVLRSLTKFFAIPGLRLGYLAAGPERITRMRQVREPWQVTQFAQMAGERCVQRIDYHEATRTLIRDERAWLTSQLAAIRGLSPYDSRVNFLLVQVDPDRALVRTVYERLMSRRVIIRRCDGWSGVPENCFRVAVRSRAENQRLVDELGGCLCAVS